ncbi:MAG: AhpC/TSA family protein [Pedobacter sp.]|nr:MAG: AhpC/TSA family protein [Pedobacter sp.]
MMKRLIYILVVCIAFAACKDKDKFVISGEFKNTTPKSKVYLYGINKNNTSALDSTVFSDKGEFKFTHSTPGADFFKVTADDKEYMIIAANGDNVNIKADLTDPNMGYEISGATEADKLQEMNTTKNQYTAKMAALQKTFEETVAKQPENRDMIMQQMMPRYNEEIKALSDALLKFAQDNTSSLAGFYAINLLNPAEYEKEMIAYSDKIKSSFNKNEVVTEFLTRMAGLKAVSVGQNALDFTINNLEGKPVNLSDFKGKYVLLDFWASWCMPCRQENPNIVKAYNAFKDKNFTIIGISLDKDPAAWKKAIQDDNLTWTHVSDLKDFESPTARLYQIESIPSSFLIDPSGKIIAKNLRGEELEAFLSKTLL